MAKLKIALLDDDKKFLKANEYSLKDEYDVKIFTIQETCIEAIKIEKFDILILDYYMDDMNGDEVITNVRKFDKDICIILYTAYSNYMPGEKALNDFDIQSYYEKGKWDLKVIIKNTVKCLKKGMEKEYKIPDPSKLNAKYIGRRIKEIRMANSHIQEDLAKILGVKRNTIATWEIGVTSPDLVVLAKIAEIYKVSLNQFIL